MTIQAGRRRFLQVILSIFLGVIVISQINSCTPDLGDDQIPIQPFADIVVQLNLPQYVKLATNGGSMEISGGVRGIILYRQSSTSYIAFEKNCSYHPNDACATVEVHSSTLYMIDACCGSTFRFPDGEPNGGIAWRPLRRYLTLLTGNTLTVTSDIEL
jgi:hypothetical protein